MNKKKVIVLSVIGFTVFCLLAGMTACTAFFVNELEKGAELEEQRIEQQLEEPAIEDEYLNEDDLGMIELPGQPEPEQPAPQPQQGEAYNAVAPFVDEAFGPTGLNYRLSEEVVDGQTIVVLTIDLSYADIQVGVQDGTWNEISQLGLLASESMYNVLQVEGIDAHFGIIIGDVSTDTMYYSALDGQLIMDIPNGVQ